jgi:hypothetical protein
MAAVAVGAGVALIGGAVSAHQAKMAGIGAANDAARARAQMEAIKANRQKITNPYANDKDLSSMAKDLSGMITNPYANLGVATQAAEIQMEQSDIALANTLDTLRETGAGAGGATALAQAALQSKKGVAASIEQQEGENEKLKAQGEAQKNQAKMSEKQRLQGIQISEGQRLQQNEAAGKQFMFNAEEARTNQDLGYTAGQEQQALQNQASANEAGAAAWSSAFAGVGSALGGMGGGVGGGASKVKSVVSPGMAAAGIKSNAQSAASQLSSLNPLPSAAQLIRSDRRLKNNINLIGKSNSGLNIYSFEYINKKFGHGVFQGVMSDEVSLNAVTKSVDGYDMVDYSLLDVEFKKI